MSCYNCDLLLNLFACIRFTGVIRVKERKELNIQIGERIRRARETAGLTQDRLSDMAGVSIQYISDLERGITGASVPTMIRLCECLKVSCDYIMMGRNEPRADALERVKYLTEDQQRIVERCVNLLIEAFSTGG